MLPAIAAITSNTSNPKSDMRSLSFQDDAILRIEPSCCKKFMGIGGIPPGVQGCRKEAGMNKSKLKNKT
jgi:hypothetical protein